MRNDNEPLLSNDSEIAAHSKIQELFERASPGCRILTNIIIPTHADISVSPATAEYDVIVVCRYGVIHFEVKGWNGKELFSEVDNRGRSCWKMSFPGTPKIEERRNALKQCVGKTRLLRQELGVWTQHFVLFTCPELQIAPNMSPYLVTMDEASFLPRLIRMRHKELGERILDQRHIDAIADAMLEAGAGITPEMHKANVDAYVQYGPPSKVTCPEPRRASDDPHLGGMVKSRHVSKYEDISMAGFLLSRPVPLNPVDELLGSYPLMRDLQPVWHMAPRHLMVPIPV